MRSSAFAHSIHGASTSLYRNRPNTILRRVVVLREMVPQRTIHRIFCAFIVMPDCAVVPPNDGARTGYELVLRRAVLRIMRARDEKSVRKGGCCGANGRARNVSIQRWCLFFRWHLERERVATVYGTVGRPEKVYRFQRI